jgi:predicted kinase
VDRGSLSSVTGQVIILTGPSGAGKSTIAVKLAARYNKGVHLHTDDFWHYIVSGAIPPYDPASDAQNQTVMDVIAGAAYTYALGGFTTVIDGIVGPWMLHHFRTRAAQHPELAVHYVVLRPQRNTTLKRAQARAAPSALIDERPILSMWDQFSDLGELDSHVLDTSHEVEEHSVQRVESIHALSSPCSTAKQPRNRVLSSPSPPATSTTPPTPG